jgi:hypothetical protein
MRAALRRLHGRDDILASADIGSLEELLEQERPAWLYLPLGDDYQLPVAAGDRPDRCRCPSVLLPSRAIVHFGLQRSQSQEDVAVSTCAHAERLM